MGGLYIRRAPGARSTGRGKENAVFTSVHIDEELLDKALALSGLGTKRALFEEVLRTYVRLHEQAGVRELRGKLAWKGDLDEIRGERGADPR
jgi:Arc/MetJ family transcription regulator